IGRDRTNEIVREVLRREFGERHWYEDFLRAEIGPRHGGEPAHLDEEALRQETLRWYADWFRNAAVGIDDVDMDRLPIAMTARPRGGEGPSLGGLHGRRPTRRRRARRVPPRDADGAAADRTAAAGGRCATRCGH